MSESFTQLLADRFLSTDASRPIPGKLITVEVMQIDEKENFVLLNSTGLKSDIRLPLEQFLDENAELEIQVGDETQVIIEEPENRVGAILLSRIKAKIMLAWSSLAAIKENKEKVQGIITQRVKGGFKVALGVLQGFLPGSLINVQHQDPDQLIEKKELLDFKIAKLDPSRNNIVVASTASSEEQKNREALIDQLEVGQTVKGRVKGHAPYGSFVVLLDDAGNPLGTDGLIPIKELTWRKISHPSEVLSLSNAPDDIIQVKILQIKREEGKKSLISLSLKSLTEKDPWEDFESRYSVGMRLTKKKIVRSEDYGIFVEIEPNIEGLVHVSEMDWTNRKPNSRAVIQKEQDEEGRVDVVILKIDPQPHSNSSKRHISLSIKRCKENPWQTFAKKHQPQDRIKGEIRSVTDLGLFVNLEGNIDGLVHHSTLKHMNLNQFSKGEKVEVSILSIDPEQERIALSFHSSSENHNQEHSTGNTIQLQEEVPSTTVDPINDVQKEALTAEDMEDTEENNLETATFEEEIVSEEDSLAMDTQTAHFDSNLSEDESSNEETVETQDTEDLSGELLNIPENIELDTQVTADVDEASGKFTSDDTAEDAADEIANVENSPLSEVLMADENDVTVALDQEQDDDEIEPDLDEDTSVEFDEDSDDEEQATEVMHQETEVEEDESLNNSNEEEEEDELI